MIHKTKKYIKCKGYQVEHLENRWKIAYLRCPKCNRYITLYKDETKKTLNDLRTIQEKKCSCGHRSIYILENFFD
jgi:hypothetical protein